MGNGKKRYLITNTGAMPTIIDFSRSFLHKNVPDTERLDHTDQCNRMISAYKRFFPEYVEKNSQMITFLYEQSFDSVFKIFSALDIYSLSLYLITMLKSRDINKEINLKDQKEWDIAELNPDINAIDELNLKIPATTYALLEKIKKLASYFLVDELQKLAHHHARSIKIYPGEYIIDTLFTEYEFKAGSVVPDDTIDVYCLDNQFKYDAREYDTLPPIFKLDWEHDVLQKQLAERCKKEVPHFAKLSKEEQEKLSSDWNSPCINLPDNKILSDYQEAVVEEDGYQKLLAKAIEDKQNKLLL